MSAPSQAVYKRYDQTLKGRYRRYRSNSKQRGIKFSLTLAEFSGFWKAPCYYCGYKVFTVGLDRVNNKKGYSLDNVVSCCSHCNAGKSDMTQKQWFRLCRNVVLRHKLI